MSSNKRLLKIENLKNKKFISIIELIVIIALVLTLVGFVVFSLNEEGQEVVIQSDNKTIYTVPLNVDAEFRIEYGDHYNVIVIKDGVVYVSDSDCRQEICEHSAIRYSGQVIYCLPNKLVVTITGESPNEDEDLDFVV